MAMIYNTTLRPSKLEMLAEWLPSQEWFHSDVSQLESLGAYRFDDPAGEVGMEGHILTAGDDTVYHVPLSYRGSSFEGGDAYLLGTVDHGVLGRRWFFDAAGDPVYRNVLTDTIVEGKREALEFESDGPDAPVTPREIMTKVWGTGSAGSTLGVAKPANAKLEIVRELTEPALGSPSNWVLRGVWPAATTPAVFAVIL